MRTNNIQVAGTTTNPLIGTQVMEAKTFLMLRTRVQTAAQAALTPPHLRRPRKSSSKNAGRWPSRITFKSLQL